MDFDFTKDPDSLRVEMEKQFDSVLAVWSGDSLEDCVARSLCNSMRELCLGGLEMVGKQDEVRGMMMGLWQDVYLKLLPTWHTLMAMTEIKRSAQRGN